MTVQQADLWVTRPVPRPSAEFRLFCFPYAGAGAAAYRGWADALPARTDVEVLPIRLPGRENRLAEPPETRIDEVADGIESWIDRPYALYGHSVGARIAFDLARELRRRGRRPAEVLCVSGCPAPQLPIASPEDSSMDDRSFLQRVMDLGGMPPAVLENDELRDLVLPALRADFAYVDTYQYQAEDPLDMPIHAIGGDRDPEAPVETIHAWHTQTSAGFRCAILTGDHFFIHRCEPRVLELLAMSVDSCGARR